MIGIYLCKKAFADTNISVVEIPIALLRKSGNDVLIKPPPPTGTPPKTGGE